MKYYYLIINSQMMKTKNILKTIMNILRILLGESIA